MQLGHDHTRLLPLHCRLLRSFPRFPLSVWYCRGGYVRPRRLLQTVYLVVIHFSLSNRLKPLPDKTIWEVIDPNSDTVGIFKGIYWLQSLPTLATLIDRILQFNGFDPITSFDDVFLILEYVVNVVLFVKGYSRES